MKEVIELLGSEDIDNNEWAKENLNLVKVAEDKKDLACVGDSK
jgi:hypothetical protein